MSKSTLKTLAKEQISNYYYVNDDEFVINRFLENIEDHLIGPYVLAFLYRVITDDLSPLYIIRYSNDKNPNDYQWFINKIFLSEFDASLFAKDPDITKIPMNAMFNKYKIERI